MAEGTRTAHGFLLSASWRMASGVPRLELMGVLDAGGAFRIEETRFRPYAFARERDRALLEPLAPHALEPTELRDLAGEPVLRVGAGSPGELTDLVGAAAARGVALLEADLRFAQRYLIDRAVRGALRIEGAPAPLGPRLLGFRDPELGPSDYRPELSVLSIDIETTPRADAVYSIALLGAGADEVHVVSLDPVPGALAHRDEAALLRAALERIRAIDPDVITGWNVVDFDLRVLERRCAARRIGFELGRAPGRVRLERGAGTGLFARADVPGRQVLDGMRLVRDAQIPLDDLRLETAARALLGRGKRIAPGPGAVGEIQRLYREDRAALVAYNREDARLVLDLLEQEDLVALAVERSLLTGMLLDRVHLSVASFDSIYLPRLRARGRVAPSVDRERAPAHVAGGAVLDSTPGLFADVAVLDFRSLYPSLMRSFHLDPLAHALAAAAPGADGLIEAPNGARFRRGGGPLPEILDEIHARRGAARSAGSRHGDRALKILMNSLFGVLGTPACRFFDPAIANAITLFGQQTLAWTCEAIAAEGFRVLYGDTDSVFVALRSSAQEPGPDEALLRAQAEELRARTQQRVHARIRDRYGVEPQLELRLDRIYRRFFQPRLRGGSKGSKKRYAGLSGGRVEVVGLEAVRRDWPPIARRLQLGLLERVFSDRPLLPFVREIVASVRELENPAELVIRKGIRKGSLDRYSGRRPPHVEAARKLEGFSGREIRYVVTRAGPQPLADGALADGAIDPRAIDREYYLERVLRPIADAILALRGESFDQALGRLRQLSLL